MLADRSISTSVLGHNNFGKSYLLLIGRSRLGWLSIISKFDNPFEGRE